MWYLFKICEWCKYLNIPDPFSLIKEIFSCDETTTIKAPVLAALLGKDYKDDSPQMKFMLELFQNYESYMWSAVKSPEDCLLGIAISSN